LILIVKFPSFGPYRKRGAPASPLSSTVHSAGTIKEKDISFPFSKLLPFLVEHYRFTGRRVFERLSGC
jgi:hypothetical protein